MNADLVIGRPLPQALEALAREGISPAVMYTLDPLDRRGTEGKTPRVVAVRGETLVVAYFADSSPLPRGDP